MTQYLAVVVSAVLSSLAFAASDPNQDVIRSLRERYPSAAWLKSGAGPTPWPGVDWSGTYELGLLAELEGLRHRPGFAQTGDQEIVASLLRLAVDVRGASVIARGRAVQAIGLSGASWALPKLRAIAESPGYYAHSQEGLILPEDNRDWLDYRASVALLQLDPGTTSVQVLDFLQTSLPNIRGYKEDTLLVDALDLLKPFTAEKRVEVYLLGLVDLLGAEERQLRHHTEMSVFRSTDRLLSVLISLGGEQGGEFGMRLLSKLKSMVEESYQLRDTLERIVEAQRRCGKLLSGT